MSKLPRPGTKVKWRTSQGETAMHKPEALKKGVRREYHARLSVRRLKSARISPAALCPGAPATPPPGWVPEPHI